MGRRDPGPGQAGLWEPDPPARPRPDLPAAKLPAQPTTTQVAAAARALPASGSKRAVILDMFRSRHAYRDGFTDAELVRHTRWPENTVRPRRIELAEQGWVRDSGTTRPTPTGSPATVWIFVPEPGEVRAG